MAQVFDGSGEARDHQLSTSEAYTLGTSAPSDVCVALILDKLPSLQVYDVISCMCVWA